MDYLQYYSEFGYVQILDESFKPYYKWITFNTEKLIARLKSLAISFKPYYKWITFNTEREDGLQKPLTEESFKPYYKWITFNTVILLSTVPAFLVLNLIINGLPSIQIICCCIW